MASDTTKSATLAIGGLAAILASTCCLGPLVLIDLGFSGATSVPDFKLPATIEACARKKHLALPKLQCIFTGDKGFS